MAKEKTIKILFVGDLVQKIGRKAVGKILPDLREELGLDLVIVNGEHASTGMGIQENAYQELIDSGVDFITSGNHIYRKPQFIERLNDKDIKIIRPANFPEGVPGRGYDTLTVKGVKIGIFNFVGQESVRAEADSPFRKAEEILKKSKAKIKIVDFHAEMTSEKVGFANFLDGRVSAVLGTHTHVATADQRILPKGTAFVSDVGMVGPIDSILGLEKEGIINRFVTGMPAKHVAPLKGECIFNSVLVEVDLKGAALNIERIDRTVMVD